MASTIEIRKISRGAFAVAALCERRKTAVPAPRGKLQPPLQDGHPQPVEAGCAHLARHGSKATVYPHSFDSNAR